MNAPQEILYRARHSLTLADDVSPDRGEHEAAARLSEFVRMQANHIAKQRLDRDSELALVFPATGSLADGATFAGACARAATATNSEMHTTRAFLMTLLSNATAFDDTRRRLEDGVKN